MKTLKNWNLQCQQNNRIDIECEYVFFYIFLY